jgi:hypothetical protein
VAPLLTTCPPCPIPGVRAACRAQVPRLRAERRSFQPDPRYNHVVQLVRSGLFGW